MSCVCQLWNLCVPMEVILCVEEDHEVWLEWVVGGLDIVSIADSNSGIELVDKGLIFF